MIDSKKKLRFYIKADRMINYGKFDNTIFDYLKYLVGLNKIGRFLVILRKYEYYINAKPNLCRKIMRGIYKYRWIKMGMKLGFTIYPNVCDYALSLDHWGTIVVGNDNRIGAYALIHTGTCIPWGEKRIGKFLRLSAGAKISGWDIKLGDGISIAANSVVTHDCEEDNKLLAGMPAKVVKEAIPWVIKDGEPFTSRYKAIEELKERMGIDN